MNEGKRAHGARRAIRDKETDKMRKEVTRDRGSREVTITTDRDAKMPMPMPSHRPKLNGLIEISESKLFVSKNDGNLQAGAIGTCTTLND